MDRRLLSISEVAQASGLQSSALRYYEKSGLIGSRGRIGGRRQFDRSVLQRLAVISLLQEAGFTIGEISDLIGGGSRRERWQTLAKKRLGKIDAHLERVHAARELLLAALNCECSGLDSCKLVQERTGKHRRVVQKLSPPSTFPPQRRPGTKV